MDMSLSNVRELVMDRKAKNRALRADGTRGGEGEGSSQEAVVETVCGGEQTWAQGGV